MGDMSIEPVKNCQWFTCKHPLQLVRVFESTGLFELRDHTRFGLVRCRHAMNQTFRQLGGVELLEYILILEVFKEDHLMNAKHSGKHS